jgi:hypothetical protein
MKIHGVHGIWTDGKKNIRRMLNWLESRYGYATREVRLPRRNPFSARFRAPEDARLLIEGAQDGDIAIGHSYGCAVVAQAMKQVEFSHVFLFRPAMEHTYLFPGNRTVVHCIHSKGDWAIFVGMMLRVGHPFGSAGRTGFDDPRVKNLLTRGGHSADFDRLPQWGAYIHSNIREQRSRPRVNLGRYEAFY